MAQWVILSDWNFLNDPQDRNSNSLSTAFWILDENQIGVKFVVILARKKSFIFNFPLISFNVHTFCEQNQVHNFNVEWKTLEGYISLLHQHHLKCAIHLGLLKKFSHLFVSRLWKQTILKNLWICLLNYTFFDVPLTETRLPRNRKVFAEWKILMNCVNGNNKCIQ